MLQTQYTIGVYSMGSSLNNKFLLGMHLNGKRIIGIADKNAILYREIYKIYTGTNIAITDTKNDTGSITKIECASTQVQTVQGKNLIDLDVNTITLQGVTITNNFDGTITLNGTAVANVDLWFTYSNSSNMDIKKAIRVLTGETYTLSRTIVSGTATGNTAIFASFINDSSAFTWNYMDTTGIPSKTATQNGYISGVRIIGTTGNVFNNLVVKVQIEKSSSATSYTPFVPNSPSIMYPSEIVNSTSGINRFDTLNSDIGYAGSSLVSRDNNQITVSAPAGTYEYFTTRVYLNAGVYTFQRKISVLSGTATSETGYMILYNDNLTASYIYMPPTRNSGSYYIRESGYYKMVFYVCIGTATTTAVTMKIYDIQINSGNIALLWEEYGNKPINVWAHKKNTFDTLKSSINYTNTTSVSRDNNQITFSGTAGTYRYLEIRRYINAGTYKFQRKFQVLSGTEISATGVTNIYTDDFNTLIGQIPKAGSNVTLTISTSGYYRFIFYISSNTATTNTVQLKIYDIQLETGSTATPYEPYTASEYPITLPSGFVGGSLPNGVMDTIENGIATGKIGKVVLNGAENWVLDTGASSQINTICFYYRDATKFVNKGDTSNTYSDKFVYKTGTNTATQDLEGISERWNQIGVRILRSRLSTQDLAGFKTYLATNPFTVYYELATPISTTLALPNIDTYKDYTAITTTNTVQPSLTVQTFTIGNRE